MNSIRLIATAAALAPVAAYGQSREPFETSPSGPLLRPDVAGSRQPSGLAPTGARLGRTIVQPSMTVRAEADSNVLNRTEDKRGDTFVIFAPAVKTSGDIGRASYVLQAEAAVARFASLTSQNRETFGVDASVRVEPTRRTALFARASFDRRVEPNSAPGASDVEGSPTEYDQTEVQLAARTELAATRITASATMTKLVYADIKQDDGTKADQSFRDTRSVALGLNAEHALRTGPTLLLQANYGWIDSLSPDPDADRTGQGGRVLAGARFELTKLITAEILGGYIFRDYKSPVFKDFGGIAWRARVNWYPTPLFSFALASERTIVNSGVRDTGGIVVDTTSLQIFYEMRRNLDWVLTFSQTDEDYQDSASKAHSNTIGLEGRYTLSSRLTAGVYTRYRDRNAKGTERLRAGSGVEGGLWLRASR